MGAGPAPEPCSEDSLFSSQPTLTTHVLVPHMHTRAKRISAAHTRTHAPRDTPKYTGLAVSHTHILAHAHTHSRAHTHTLTEEHFFLLLLMPPKRNLSPAAFFPLPFLFESLEPLIFFLTPGPER